MLPIQVKVNLEAMAMKGYSTLPQIYKAGASPSGGLMSYLGHSLEGVLPLWRDAVKMFYSPSRVGCGT